METLRDLFTHELQDLYTAERLLIDALPKLAGAATDGDAQKAFEDHLEETRGHLKRLERVAADAQIRLEARECPGMEGLLREQEEFTKERPDEDLLAFFNLWAAQKVERYEMTAYESLIALADELGMGQAAEQLAATLDEEEAALNTLKELAEEFDTSALSSEEAAEAAEGAEAGEAGEDAESEAEAPARRST